MDRSLKQIGYCKYKINADVLNDANYLSFCYHNGWLSGSSTIVNVTCVRNLRPKINCLFISQESAARCLHCKNRLFISLLNKNSQ